MDEQNQIQEVVLCYSQPKPREVVLVYQGTPFDDSMDYIPHRRQRNRRKSVLTFCACLCLVAIVAGGLLWATRWKAGGDGYFEQTPELSDTQGLPVTIPLYEWDNRGIQINLERQPINTLTAPEVYQAVSPAVVTILADVDEVSMSMGTGVLFTSDGFLLTNYHVVEGAADCHVMLSTGEIQQAQYIGGDEYNDLAVLKIQGEGYPAASFGESDWVEVGDSVYAIGTPLELDLYATFTSGMVSGLNRYVTLNERAMSDLIQTDTALNTGNSGGPLINEYGQVVGINTLKMGSGGSTIEGLGFAIPSSTVARVVWDLTEIGEVQPEPTIGIMVGVTPTQIDDGRWGSMVHSVTAESAADIAGVLPGDIVLYANGTEVFTSDDILRVRRQCRIGDSLELQVYRNGEELMLLLELFE